MIVLLSDLHITDASTDINFSPEAFAILKTEIENNILKHPSSGKATEVRIVLLGDIFDLVRTDYWLENKIGIKDRPWGGIISSQTGMNSDIVKIQKQFEAILDKILLTETAIGLQSILNSLAGLAGINNIYFKVSYVVGNHDRLLWNFQTLQDRISGFLLDNQNTSRVFEFVQNVQDTDYGILARHGHEWDSECYSIDFYNKVLNKGEAALERFNPELDRVMAIGEVITAELMSGFIWRLKGKIKGTILTKLMEIHTVRPSLAVFQWIAWFMTSSNVNEEFRKLIIAALRDSLDDLLESGLAKKWDDIKAFIPFLRGDITDTLGVARTILNTNLDWYKILNRLTSLLTPILSSADGNKDYIKGAESDFKMQNDEHIQYVIYGHTHEAMSVYLEGYANEKHKTYINTGTYLPLSQKARDYGFVTNYQMTLLTFFNKDEDKAGKVPGTTSMDLWNGIKRKLYSQI